MRTGEFANSLCFRLGDGTTVYPKRMTRRSDGAKGFQILSHYDNLADHAVMTDDEREMQRLVRVEGRRCRCASKCGGKVNAYNGQRDSTMVIVRDLLHNPDLS